MLINTLIESARHRCTIFSAIVQFGSLWDGNLLFIHCFFNYIISYLFIYLYILVIHPFIYTRAFTCVDTFIIVFMVAKLLQLYKICFEAMHSHLQHERNITDHQFIFTRKSFPVVMVSCILLLIQIFVDYGLPNDH